MNRSECRQLIEKWRLRLAPEWKIDVHFESPPDVALEESGDYNAAIGTVNAYQRAHLYYLPEALVRSRLECEQTVVHEILHLVLHELDVLDEAAAEALPTKALRHHHQRARSRELEQVIDRLARTFVS